MANQKTDTFEWLCNNCNYLHIETAPKRLDGLLQVVCSQCGTARELALIELPEVGFAGNWMSTKCWQCQERSNCFSKSNKKIFQKRLKAINKLGSCEDYAFDHAAVKSDRFQARHDEISFDEIYNSEEFPLDKED